MDIAHGVSKVVAATLIAEEWAGCRRIGYAGLRLSSCKLLHVLNLFSEVLVVNDFTALCELSIGNSEKLLLLRRS